MDLSLFNYELPDGRIAYYPARQRDLSRLMVLDRNSGQISHGKFPDVVDYMQPGDGLVVNDTRVLKARLYARRLTGGKVEIFLLEEINYEGGNCWQVLTHPTRRVKEGEELFLDETSTLEVVKKLPTGKSIIKFKSKTEAARIIAKYGHIPLPIYIHRPDEKKDETRYQTIFSRVTKTRAVAAPTAGLHFTNRTIGRIKKKGVEIIPITLHVGYGTFKTVKVDNIDEHSVDPEYAEISKGAASRINKIREAGGKIFAVGTTSVRTLESASIIDGKVQPFSDYVDLYIKPGHEFKLVDHLITNFHLPRSSLMILVSAFAGREKIIEAYNMAVDDGYRFYSYGDCMLIL
ncbi:MAG: tRNA preQ1(34) S-adenosylmethionine ribosyltransferase-isomerase QueA [Candidatus Zixiibacteriota bacterium]|nr:MAG: tRNA preQ1(34) S-adenosylmethionine ribosyltransferase-isomerase QueA [candidate division Zixibacteria bacterium]